MLAVRAYNCDGSEDFKVNGQAGGRRSETVRVYYDREAVSQKRRKQFASVCAEGFFKTPHNQGITMPIRWSMGGFTMHPQGELYSITRDYSRKRTTNTAPSKTPPIVFLSDDDHCGISEERPATNTNESFSRRKV